MNHNVASLIFNQLSIFDRVSLASTCRAWRHWHHYDLQTTIGTKVPFKTSMVGLLLILAEFQGCFGFPPGIYKGDKICFPISTLMEMIRSRKGLTRRIIDLYGRGYDTNGYYPLGVISDIYDEMTHVLNVKSQLNYSYRAKQKWKRQRTLMDEGLWSFIFLGLVLLVHILRTRVLINFY